MVDKSLTRREFLAGSAKVAAGTAIGAGMLSMLAGCQASNATETGTATATMEPAAAETATETPAEAPAETVVAEGTPAAVPAWPWPYVKLDPQVVAEAAYQGYYEGGCMFGAYAAILRTLQTEAGFPFTQIPVEMSKYGAGGVSGWGTLCGTLNGAGSAINLVAKDYGKIIGELMAWYSTTSFPTYQPSAPKVEIGVASVSGSPLCHVSVSKWCEASGFKEESAERKERCARLTAEVAAHAVELLNQYADSGEFTPTLGPADSVKECGACHLKGGTVGNTLAQMDCVQCHEPHTFTTGGASEEVLLPATGD